jgi:hypothetical protein
MELMIAGSTMVPLNDNRINDNILVRPVAHFFSFIFIIRSYIYFYNNCIFIRQFLGE